MAEFTGQMGPVDEDGYRTVVVLADGVEVDRQYLRYDMAGQWLAQEVYLRQRMEDTGDALCEHGLSAALCDGPGHYPADY